MRLRLIHSCILGLALATALQMTRPVHAQKSDELPLKRIVLFHSGVGYFEHQTDLKGDAEVELQFNVTDINDVLKSIVLQTTGGVQFSGINYDAEDSLTRSLQSFSFDLTDEPTIGDLMRQLRGEPVTLNMDSPVSGLIVGLELRQESTDAEGSIGTEYINLMTNEGLKSVPLRSVNGLQLDNEKLRDELRKALALLASSRQSDKRKMQLKFHADGPYTVQVGYVRESPVWKTSYRLVLEKEQKALLQGWGIVENTSEIDWTDVRLTLISGQPISFVTNLYQPRYVQRPIVALDEAALVTSRLYQRDLSPRAARAGAGGGMGGGGGSGGGGFGGGGLGGMPGRPANDGKNIEETKQPFKPDLEVQAQAAEVGEFFQYEIDSPVTLERRRSAMLPIVNDPVKAERFW